MYAIWYICNFGHNSLAQICCMEKCINWSCYDQDLNYLELSTTDTEIRPIWTCFQRDHTYLDCYQIDWTY